MMGIRLRGIENVRAALGAARGLSERFVLVRRLEMHWDDAVLEIQRSAQHKAPVKHGHLRGSATSSSRFDGVKLVGQVQFGGLASAYAEVQHDRTDFQHPKGGTDHFLYGKPYSAWEEAEGGALRQLDDEVGRIAEEEIGGAARG